MKKKAPYGSWPSAISAEAVAKSSTKISDPLCQQGKVFWSESIAEENGRNAIMMYDGLQRQCILPHPLSAKSRVHEYGGAAYTIHQNHLIFVLASDQRIYTGEYTQEKFCPTALSPDNNNLRFADLRVDKTRQRIIAICESHFNGEVKNTLVSLSLDGNQVIETLCEGFDFYSNPRVSPNGKYLSWLCWNHPDMPWDNTELWTAKITSRGLDDLKKMAGGKNESLFQAQWSPDNTLMFVSDKSNWWNLYHIAKNEFEELEPKASIVVRKEAEFATPQWVFGMSTYGFLDENTVFACYTSNGLWHLLEVEKKDGDDWSSAKISTIDCESTHIEGVHTMQGQAGFIGASANSDRKLYLHENKKIVPLIDSRTNHGLALIDKNEYASPIAITFDTSDDQIARALFYAPHNTQYESEDEELPPLIVICHGGPTGATESSLNLKIQYWTNRGFAVADVNYRGSTGYGRVYRQQLFHQWGVYDVDDVCAAVEHLAAEKLIDRNRCMIKGSSAGGYTVLAALTFRKVFKAGVSLYGIGDLETLAKDTHKFEAHYLDKLIGAYPESISTYRVRSPIHFIDQIDCPLLIFQGMQDKVVPPNQAKALHKKINEKKNPVSLVCYEDEAHGFRKAETIIHCIESELQFYGKIFDIAVDSAIEEKINIQNLED